MRLFSFLRSPAGALLALAAIQPLPLAGQGPSLADIQDRRLANGVRVLVVERPATGAVHARIFIRATAAPLALVTVTAHSLFGVLGPEDGPGPDPELESLLLKEEGLREELRLAALKRGRGSEAAGSELAELHRASLADLRPRLLPSDGFDRLDALGAARREIHAGVDHLAYGLDLPATSFPGWCEAESGRLKVLRLSHLPFYREQALRDAITGGDPAKAAFLAVAFPGHPYGQEAAGLSRALEAVRLDDARAFARRAVHPESVALVLVGDLTADRVMPILEGTFGLLPSEHRGTPVEPPPAEAAPGARRLQATLPGEPRLLMGWRLPPRGHPDFLGLRVLAKLLAGGPSSRLRWGPLGERGILGSLKVALGEPGSRDGGLLTLEATAGEGHSLGEVEQALISEVLRVQQEPIQEEEVAGAQRLLLLETLLQQEDAAAFAQSLGEAWSEAGTWQAALLDPARLKAWGSEELRRLARTYLSSDRGVTTLVEPDLLTSSEDPLDVRLVEAIRQMARRRIDDPAAVDALVRQTIRQLRMLPRAERENALELLKPAERP